MNKKQLLLIATLLSGTQVNAMNVARAAAQRLVMSSKSFGKNLNTKAGQFVKNGIDRAEAKSAEFGQNLANSARNMSNSARESAKGAPRAAGLAVWGKVKEDPYAAAGAGVGAGTGAVLSGEGVAKTTTGIFAGAFAGWHIGKTKGHLRNIQKDLGWLKENAATKTDLSDAVTKMTTHADDLAKKGGEFARNIFRRLRKGQKNTDKQLTGMSNKMNSLATKEDIAALAKDNKALHEKAYTALTEAKGRIGDVWTKWVKDKS